MAGPDARRVRRGADRAGRPVEHRAVGRVAAVPAVALDAALEALALRDADDIHELARLEHLHRERLSHLVALELLGLLEPDLADDPHRGDVRLLEEARLGLGHVLLLGAKAELERVVAMGVLGPDPHDRAWPRLDDGHGHLVAVVAEDLGHTDLAADEPLLARHQLIRRVPRRPRPSPPLGEAAAKPPLEGPAAGRSTRPRYESARGRESKWRASRGPREEPTGTYAGRSKWCRSKAAREGRLRRTQLYAAGSARPSQRRRCAIFIGRIRA